MNENMWGRKQKKRAPKGGFGPKAGKNSERQVMGLKDTRMDVSLSLHASD